MSQSGEGFHWTGVKFNDEHKSNISNAIKKSHSEGVFFMKGKKHTEETKMKMSSKQSGENHHQFGKPLTQETKQKVSFSIARHKHPRFKFGSINERKYDYIYTYKTYSDENVTKGTQKSKCFSFNKYGSKENAFKACKEFQKTIYPELTKNENENDDDNDNEIENEN